MQARRRRFGQLAGVLGSACAAAHAHGQVWSFTRIADTSTGVPGTAATFQRFGTPSIGSGVVAFSGHHDFPAPTTAGVYTGNGGPLTTIADHTTPIPAGTGSFIGFEPWPSQSSGATAFIGDGTGVSFIQRGIYIREGNNLTRVVDRATLVPNGSGGNFFAIGQPSLNNGHAAFVGYEFGDAQRGVYSWQNGSLSVIADKSTPIPGGQGAFTNFSETQIDGTHVLFTGAGTGPQGGLYRAEPSGLITPLYDTNTLVPGGGGATFGVFTRFAAADGAVTILAGGGGLGGIFTDAGGVLHAVALGGDPVPGRPGQTFANFSFMSLDAGEVAFSAVFGVDTGVFATHGGVLGKVLAGGDPFDGKIVMDASIGGQALDGDSLAIWVAFTDGSQGIYMATIPAPATLVLLSAAGLFAARRKRG